MGASALVTEANKLLLQYKTCQSIFDNFLATLKNQKDLLSHKPKLFHMNSPKQNSEASLAATST